MIKDVKITKTGDIEFDSVSNEHNSINILFYYTKTKAIRIQFNIERKAEYSKDGQLNINFNIENKKFDKRINVVKDDELLAQEILIRLKTSLNEILSREEYGSRLEELNHLRDTDKNREKIRTAICEAIKDVLPSCYVVVSSKIVHDPYKQITVAKIYKNESDAASLVNYTL